MIKTENYNDFNVPVVLLFFKRPRETSLVFEQIKKVRPKKLFLIADGPRNIQEYDKCLATRKIVENITWDCEVKKNYSENNLGCKDRVSSGIDWVFSQVEEAIILEDDCVPSESFFYYCKELLDKYRDNNKIMNISGVNFQQGNALFECIDDYYFSLIPQIWGWATWKRAWKLYDKEIENWPKVKENRMLNKIFTDPAVADYWEYLFSNMYSKKNTLQQIDTWDAQWVFSCLYNNGLSINPRVNLITNIGYSQDATRTKNNKGNQNINIINHDMKFPIKHPDTITINSIADKYSLENVWNINKTKKQKIRSFLKFKTPILYKIMKRIKFILQGMK